MPLPGYDGWGFFVFPHTCITDRGNCYSISSGYGAAEQPMEPTGGQPTRPSQYLVKKLQLQQLGAFPQTRSSRLSTFLASCGVFLWFCGVHQVLTVLRYAVLLFFFREHFFCSHPATLTLGTLPSISSIIASTAHVQPSGFLSSSLAGPLLHQLFVVCPGFSPGSAKIVSQIVSGKLMLI